jgi:hypothetical protein
MDETKQEPVRKTPPQWRTLKKPADWQFAGAAELGKWTDFAPLLTEEEFDAAIRAAGEIQIG